MSLMAQCRAKARRYENQYDTEFSHSPPRGEKAALSAGERADRDGAFTGRRGPGEPLPLGPRNEERIEFLESECAHHDRLPISPFCRRSS